MSRRTSNRRIAIIGSRGYPSYYGGFETLVRRLAPHLADRGHSVTVYGRPGSVRDDDPSRDPRVRSKNTAGLNTKSLSTISFGLTATLAAIRSRADVALVMNVANGYWLPLLRLCGVKTVVNVDGIEWERAKWGRLARYIFRIGARMTARWADELIFDAQAIGDYWKKNFHRDGTFIPYGGEATFTEADGLPFEDETYALLVARFVPENTINEFFDAVDRMDRTRFVVVGTSGFGGPLDRRIEDLAAGRDNVQWLGHVSDDSQLFSLWKKCGAYFHGHSVGGTNPALVQAMACGAPIVARDTVYNREVLGAAGVFVPPTPDGIVEGLEAVLGDPVLRSRISKESRERARRQYSWELVLDGYTRALAPTRSGSVSKPAAVKSAE
ncbi:glycosyltransferase [Williamsia deligens]|uniref:Glycosyltransferase n=1 Tax=Williamsia deligens TaxID=321325 RepID=A0ABW3G546_9NOCA|nr:glycosyltransferase [Williamsia deligens]MCP2194529.1 Glycosyltransferase involved in cell wall bisynthesis [Williamsia deligens]